MLPPCKVPMGNYKITYIQIYKYLYMSEELYQSIYNPPKHEEITTNCDPRDKEFRNLFFEKRMF